MKYENKSFSVGMPRVSQEQWDAIFAKKRLERKRCLGLHCAQGGECPSCDGISAKNPSPPDDCG